MSVLSRVRGLPAIVPSVPESARVVAGGGGSGRAWVGETKGRVVRVGSAGGVPGGLLGHRPTASETSLRIWGHSPDTGMQLITFQRDLA